jgi:hypothetical protein
VPVECFQVGTQFHRLNFFQCISELHIQLVLQLGIGLLIVKVKEIVHILAVKRVDPLAYYQTLMQQFHASVLPLVFRLETSHVNVRLELHRVDLHNGLNHFVQQVNPAQDYLLVALIRLARLKRQHLLFSGARLQHQPHLLGHLGRVESGRLLTLLIQLAKRPAHGAVQFLLHCFTLHLY